MEKQHVKILIVTNIFVLNITALTLLDVVLGSIKIFMKLQNFRERCLPEAEQEAWGSQGVE